MTVSGLLSHISAATSWSPRCLLDLIRSEQRWLQILFLESQLISHPYHTNHLYFTPPQYLPSRNCSLLNHILFGKYAFQSKTGRELGHKTEGRNLMLFTPQSPLSKLTGTMHRWRWPTDQSCVSWETETWGQKLWVQFLPPSLTSLG